MVQEDFNMEKENRGITILLNIKNVILSIFWSWKINNDKKKGLFLLKA
jgi:hypothetical protein